MRKLAPLLAAFCVLGCHSESPSTDGPPPMAPPGQPPKDIPKGPPNRTSASNQPNYGGNGGGGVAPIGSGMAGGITPMTGTESVGGGGMGGVGQAAKDQARNAAAKAGGGGNGFGATGD